MHVMFSGSGSGQLLQQRSHRISLPLACAAPVSVSLNAVVKGAVGSSAIVFAARARAGDCVVVWREGQARAAAVQGGGVADVIGVAEGFLCVCDGDVKVMGVCADAIVEVRSTGRGGQAVGSCIRLHGGDDDGGEEEASVIDLTQRGQRAHVVSVRPAAAGAGALQALMSIADDGGGGGVLQSLMSISTSSTISTSSPAPSSNALARLADHSHSKSLHSPALFAAESAAAAAHSSSLARLVYIDCSSDLLPVTPVMAWSSCVVAPPVAACELRRQF